MALYRLEIAAFAYPVQKLKSLTIGKPQYGANERGVERTDPTVPRYVRITDIDEYGRLKDGMGVAAENAEDKYFLHDGDLLFARSGNTVGKAYLHRALREQNCLFAGYMIRFRANVDTTSPEYLFLCTQLEFYQHWVSATQRATGQPNINAEEYRSLELPVPDLGIQSKLVEDYKKAVLAFEVAQGEANNLLVGIDDYLLAELGISLPPEPENTIANRIFTAQRRELAGFRFDARVHRANFDLVSSRFNSPPLNQIVEINPRTAFRDVEGETRLTFVPMEAITDEDGTINAPQERSFAENIGYTSFQLRTRRIPILSRGGPIAGIAGRLRKIRCTGR